MPHHDATSGVDWAPTLDLCGLAALPDPDDLIGDRHWIVGIVGELSAQAASCSAPDADFILSHNRESSQIHL
ncbi:MAG TPA: hypothetical protein DCE43_00980 [Planctomycetaceae bacterium]|nr:hypothetical protein [Planctomycetaceae bacterium]